MGGQCSYLLRVEGPAKALHFVPDGEWKTPVMAAWSGADIAALLQQAEAILLETAARLRLPVQVRYSQDPSSTHGRSVLKEAEAVL